MSVFHIAYTMHHTHVTHKEIYNLAATHTTCTVASATHVTFEIHGDARENIQYKPRENLKTTIGPRNGRPRFIYVTMSYNLTFSKF